MALVPCPECSAQVSDRAAKCPRCGCPTKTSAADPASLSPEQARAVEMLEHGSKPLVVGKATGLPMKEILRLRAEVKTIATGNVGVTNVLISWALIGMAIGGIALLIASKRSMSSSAVALSSVLICAVTASSWIFLFRDRANVQKAAGQGPDMLMALLLRPYYFWQRAAIIGHGRWMAVVDTVLLLLVGNVIFLAELVVTLAVIGVIRLFRRMGFKRTAMVIAAGAIVAVALVLVLNAPPAHGFRVGDEVRILGMPSHLRAQVIDYGDDFHGRPMVRLRIDNGPKATVRYEEMPWPVDELEKVDSATANQTR